MRGHKICIIAGAEFVYSTINGAEQALSRLSGPVPATGDAAPAAPAAVPDTLEAAAAKYVSDFMLRVPSLAMGKHLHLLVYVYNWFQTKMAYRFTVDEALDLSAWDAVGRLEDTVDIDLGRRLLRDFEEAWNEMQNEFQTYLDCNHAQALGESDIPRVDVKVMRSVAISHFTCYLASVSQYYCGGVIQWNAACLAHF